MQRHPYLNTVSSYILKLHAYSFIFMASESEYRSKEANDHDAGYHLSKRAWLKKDCSHFSPNFVSRVLSFVP